jgi:hypothetical protein
VTWTIEVARGDAFINPIINAHVGGLFHWSVNVRCGDNAIRGSWLQVDIVPTLHFGEDSLEAKDAFDLAARLFPGTDSSRDILVGGTSVKSLSRLCAEEALFHGNKIVCGSFCDRIRTTRDASEAGRRVASGAYQQEAGLAVADPPTPDAAEVAGGVGAAEAERGLQVALVYGAQAG